MEYTFRGEVTGDRYIVHWYATSGRRYAWACSCGERLKDIYGKVTVYQTIDDHERNVHNKGR